MFLIQHFPEIYKFLSHVYVSCISHINMIRQSVIAK